jgi:TetR/AcrR family transcriptional regulator, regulator of cefoperazone and chloramphenicol sensitivity
MKEQTHPLSDTKKRIIETAGKVFAESGFQNATVRQICEQAGVNVAAVNYHFGDKKGLYLAVLKYGKDAVFQNHPIGAGLNKLSPPEERLKAFVSWHIGRVQECNEGEMYWFKKLIVRELMEPTEGLDMIAEEGIRPIVEILSPIVAELLGKSAAEDTVNLCCASVVGQSLFFFYAQPMIMRLFQTNRYADTKLIVDHIAHFSLNAIKKFALNKKGDRK